MASETLKIQNIPEGTFEKMSPFFNTDVNKDGKKINSQLTRKNIDTIVLHWTATEEVITAINVLKSKGLGYHFLIDINGNITQTAEIDKKMSHAGVSYGPQGRWLNRYSIGISFATLGLDSEGSPIPFNNNQLSGLVGLIRDLKIALPKLKWVTGHHWVSPRRKIDPYNFPFSLLVDDLNLNLGEDDVKFKVWKTGNGFGGDKTNQAGLTKNGTELSYTYKGVSYRFDEGYLTNEVREIARLAEQNPTVNDIDDSELNAEEEDDNNELLVKINQGLDTTFEGFGKIKSVS